MSRQIQPVVVYHVTLTLECLREYEPESLIHDLLQGGMAMIDARASEALSVTTLRNDFTNSDTEE